jgi:hypothetical protein
MDELGVQIEFENVICRYQLRRQRAGEKKPRGVLRIPDADVPESVQNAFAGEDSIGGGDGGPGRVCAGSHVRTESEVVAESIVIL